MQYFDKNGKEIKAGMKILMEDGSIEMVYDTEDQLKKLSMRTTRITGLTPTQPRALSLNTDGTESNGFLRIQFSSTLMTGGSAPKIRNGQKVSICPRMIICGIIPWKRIQAW